MAKGLPRRSLVFGPAHGHAIAQHIRQSSEAVLQVETGSLYPALHRGEARGWLAAEWAVYGEPRSLPGASAWLPDRPGLR